MDVLHREGSFIDGQWQPPVGVAPFPVVNPYTEQMFGTAGIATADEVDAAVHAAHRAFTSDWSSWSLEDRIQVVERIREGLLKNKEELASLSSSSMGMLHSRARGLGRSPLLIDMYIEMARRIQWSYLRTGEDGSALITRKPIGVVAAIVPWNTPVRSEVKKVVPALLSGCTVVLKPAPETPFGAARFVEICSEAGLPDGVLNLVTGDATTGQHLVDHPLVRKVAFTGSTATGSRIWASVAPRFTRLQLELGGKSAAILLDDADLAETMPFLVQGIFTSAGQQCVATSRILTPVSRYDEVVDGMSDAARALVMGDPFDAATTLGPLVSDRQRERVLGYIDIGKSEGAVVAAGGRRPTSQPHGWFVEPTVLAHADNTMRVAREEIFGPVATIIPYDTEQDAIRIANDSQYGLGGSVYSKDPLRALAVARQVDSGYVAVNTHGITQNAPFGGVKSSGIGREHGVEGYDSFLEYVVHPMANQLAEQIADDYPIG